MTKQKEIISTINDLIETLKDGQKGFREAADAVSNPQLKSLFAEYSQQRSRFASELQMQAKSFGESEPETAGSTVGAMHRGWINLKSAITSKEESAILAECERGEDAAVQAFEKAMRADLPLSLRDIISRQSSQIETAHDQIKTLRDTAKKAA
ncbi:MAG: ferritin-like domain-containing protein [Chthoniobacterales bacterium]